MVKWIIIAILLLPLVEIAAFIVVAAVAGLTWALVLMLSTTLAGFLVLRHAGRARIAGFRVAVADTDVAGIEANAAGFLTVLAGLLLFLPGFLTDLVGAALLLSPVRRWCGSTLRASMQRHGLGDRSIVDLAPGEWEQMPQSKLSNHSNKNDRT